VIVMPFLCRDGRVQPEYQTVRVEVTAMLSSHNMFELGTVGSEEKPR
jgi:hypothetical protein